MSESDSTTGNTAICCCGVRLSTSGPRFRNPNCQVHRSDDGADARRVAPVEPLIQRWEKRGYEPNSEVWLRAASELRAYWRASQSQVRNTDQLHRSLIEMANEQNTRQQAVYGAADIRDAVEREDVLRSAAQAIQEAQRIAAPPKSLSERHEQAMRYCHTVISHLSTELLRAGAVHQSDESPCQHDQASGPSCINPLHLRIAAPPEGTLEKLAKTWADEGSYTRDTGYAIALIRCARELRAATGVHPPQDQPK